MSISVDQKASDLHAARVSKDKIFWAEKLEQLAEVKRQTSSFSANAAAGPSEPAGSRDVSGESRRRKPANET
jgi:hypothetical protein